MARQRDLLPLPLPFPHAQQLSQASQGSRDTLRKLHSKGGWQGWANEGVQVLNELHGGRLTHRGGRSPAQQQSLMHISNAYRDMHTPPHGNTPAGAFVELCQTALPFAGAEGGPTPFKPGLVSLPEGPARLVSLHDSLPSRYSSMLGSGSDCMLRDPEAVRSLFADQDVVKPYVDNAFRRPSVYAFFKWICSRGGSLTGSAGGRHFSGCSSSLKRMGGCAWC